MRNNKTINPVTIDEFSEMIEKVLNNTTELDKKLFTTPIKIGAKTVTFLDMMIFGEPPDELKEPTTKLFESRAKEFKNFIPELLMDILVETDDSTEREQLANMILSDFIERIDSKVIEQLAKKGFDIALIAKQHIDNSEYYNVKDASAG